MPDPTPSVTVSTTAPAADGATTTTTATTVKPGYRSTEFWLGLAAMLLSSAYAAGIIPAEGDASTKGWVKAVALVAMALTAVGYSVSRGNAKKS